MLMCLSEMTHRSGSFSMIDFSFWKKKIQPCLTAVTSVSDGLKGLYNEKLKPLERTYRFNDFASLTESDFDAKPMFMLLGQYSTGKINFIKHLLKCNYPALLAQIAFLLTSFVTLGCQNLVEEKDKKVKELQHKIAAVNFTPEIKMGKMLMAKCRTLQEENEKIGNQANEGKVGSLQFTIRITTLLPNSNWLFLKSIDKPAGAGHKNGKWHVLHALCADY
ncbi:EH domain-containing protein 2 [Capsicum baccatum]|uniref:EH domain-containing protein 2 n=1 Tax=Capsicum baccatum TaxID=33114 RepID=A0A2G2V7U0_CAPBA|nr:EH domain-containing protein 2 [Capsicum baccatum]